MERGDSGKIHFRDRVTWKRCHVEPFLLAQAVLDPQVLVRKPFLAKPYLLLLRVGAGIVLQGPITQFLASLTFTPHDGLGIICLERLSYTSIGKDFGISETDLPSLRVGSANPK